ncbi:MAG: AraC family transcriptional regulator [Actinomycetota bacterium]
MPDETELALGFDLPTGWVRRRETHVGLRSAQGLTVSFVCELRSPATPGGSIYAPGHHAVLWATESSTDVECGGVSYPISTDVGLWVARGGRWSLPGDTAVTCLAVVADSDHESLERTALLHTSEPLRPMVAVLQNQAGRPWAGGLVSSAIELIVEALRQVEPPMTYPTDPRARSIAEALASDPALPHDLVEWGVRVGASERTLRRLFARETGSSFAAWRLEIRMRHARALLQAGLPVSVVARRCGYDRRNSFLKAFKRAHDICPSAYSEGVAASAVGGNAGGILSAESP